MSRRTPHNFRTQKDGHGLNFWRAPKQMHARFPLTGRRVLLKRGDAAANIACCDCGLIHEMRWLVRKGYIRLTGWRDQKSTEAARRRRRIVVTKYGRRI